MSACSADGAGAARAAAAGGPSWAVGVALSNARALRTKVAVAADRRRGTLRIVGQRREGRKARIGPKSSSQTRAGRGAVSRSKPPKTIDFEHEGAVFQRRK